MYTLSYTNTTLDIVTLTESSNSHQSITVFRTLYLSKTFSMAKNDKKITNGAFRPLVLNLKSVVTPPLPELP